MNQIAKSKRYTQIVAWARNRYTKDGVLVVSTGKLIDGKAGQVPSAYSRIEDAAFVKYMSRPRDEDGCLVFGA